MIPAVPHREPSPHAYESDEYLRARLLELAFALERVQSEWEWQARRSAPQLLRDVTAELHALARSLEPDVEAPA